MFERTIQFDNDICVSGAILDKVCMSVIETIKKELPEEVQVYEVIDEVLDICKEKIKEKRVIL